MTTVWHNSWIGYDDSLDVFGIHAVGGIISDFNRCILCRKPWWSWVFGGDITSISGQVTVQCLGVGATLICSGFISTIILKVISKTSIKQ